MNVYSDFKSGSIINSAMLCSLRDRPADIFKLLFRGYPDGIISGFDVSVSEGMLSVSEGILKYEDEILVMNERKLLTLNIDVNYCGIGIRRYENDNCIYIEVFPEITAEKPNIEICRCTYSEGANLRNVPDTLEKISSPPRNTLDIRYKKMSAPDGGYLPDPLIFRRFAAEMLKKETKSVLDTTFAYLCLNGISSCNAAADYIGAEENVTPDEITKALADKLRHSATEKAPAPAARRNEDKIEVN